MFHFFQLHPQSWIYWMTYRFFALTPRWITPSSCRNRMVSFSLHPCGSNPAGTKTPVLMFFSSDGSHNHVWSTNMYNKHHQTSMVSSGPSKVLLPLFFRGILVVQVAKEEFGPDLASNAISLSLSLQTGTMCLKNIDSWDRSEPADAGFPKIHRIIAKKMMTNKKMKVDSADSDCNCWPFWWCVPWCSPLSERCPSRQKTP